MNTKNSLTEVDEDDIISLDDDVAFEDNNYAFFGNEAGYVHYLVFGEGKVKHLSEEPI